MIEQEEARLVQHVMEDSMNTYDERQWVGLEEMMALFAGGDVAIPEEQHLAVKEEVHEEQLVAAFPRELVDQCSTWSCTTTEMDQGVGVKPWCLTPPRSPKHESLPRGEVVQAPLTFQGPPAHLWTMPPYVDLTYEDDDNGGAWRRRRARQQRGATHFIFFLSYVNSVLRAVGPLNY
ncbi:hypothetical protein D1007_20236 [Hordeum vulgare]|nr:hypothetical protein D1007_20236 [Hordeum vulgare]